MHIAFIGAPCSGKTTTASMLFSQLKQRGTPCEFIPEYARQYIACIRLQRGLKPEDPLTLTDEDQVKIMSRQLDLEILMRTACGPKVTTISDSSALNALIYMNNFDTAESKRVTWMTAEALQDTNLLFVADGSSDWGQEKIVDPNRVHSDLRFYDSTIKYRLLPKLLTFCSSTNVHIAELTGSPAGRMAQVDRAYQYVLGKR